MAECLAVGMQIVFPGPHMQGPLAWSAPGPPACSWGKAHTELPELAPEAPALLPDRLDEPLSPVFPDDTGSLGGLTQTSW